MDNLGMISSDNYASVKGLLDRGATLSAKNILDFFHNKIQITAYLTAERSDIEIDPLADLDAEAYSPEDIGTIEFMFGINQPQ